MPTTAVTNGKFAAGKASQKWNDIDSTPYFVYFNQQLAKKNEQMWKQLDQQNKELEEKRKQFEREKAQYEEEQKNSGQKGLERSDSSSKSLK